MRKRPRILAIVTVVFTFLLASVTKTPSGAPGPAAQPPTSDRIQIEHEYVRIPADRIPKATVQSISAARRSITPAPEIGRQARAAPVVSAAPRTTASRSAENKTRWNRAAGALVGNRRYTPHPTSCLRSGTSRSGRESDRGKRPLHATTLPAARQVGYFERFFGVTLFRRSTSGLADNGIGAPLVTISFASILRP